MTRNPQEVPHEIKVNAENFTRRLFKIGGIQKLIACLIIQVAATSITLQQGYNALDYALSAVSIAAIIPLAHSALCDFERSNQLRNVDTPDGISSQECAVEKCMDRDGQKASSVNKFMNRHLATLLSYFGSMIIGYSCFKPRKIQLLIGAAFLLSSIMSCLLMGLTVSIQFRIYMVNTVITCVLAGALTGFAILDWVLTSHVASIYTQLKKFAYDQLQASNESTSKYLLAYPLTYDVEELASSLMANIIVGAACLGLVGCWKSCTSWRRSEFYMLIDCALTAVGLLVLCCTFIVNKDWRVAKTALYCRYDEILGSVGPPIAYPNAERIYELAGMEYFTLLPLGRFLELFSGDAVPSNFAAVVCEVYSRSALIMVQHAAGVLSMMFLTCTIVANWLHGMPRFRPREWVSAEEIVFPVKPKNV